MLRFGGVYRHTIQQRVTSIQIVCRLPRRPPVRSQAAVHHASPQRHPVAITLCACYAFNQVYESQEVQYRWRGTVTVSGVITRQSDGVVDRSKEWQRRYFVTPKGVENKRPGGQRRNHANESLSVGWRWLCI